MTTPLKAFGEFPACLYKAFDEESYARDLVERGRIRLTQVQVYKTIEDVARADSTEGEASLRIPGAVTHATLDPNGRIVETREEPGYINYSGELLNPVFIACFSYPPGGDVAQLPSHFGEFLVCITDPERFAQDITDALTAEGLLRGTPVVECVRVTYTKGERSEEIANPVARTRLFYSQKPPCFRDEHEFRFAVIATPEIGTVAPLPLHHYVELGGSLSYASLIQNPSSEAPS